MDLLAEILKPIPVVVWGSANLPSRVAGKGVYLGERYEFFYCSKYSLLERLLMQKNQGYFFILNECDSDLAKQRC